MPEAATAPSEVKLSKEDVITQRILEDIPCRHYESKISFVTRDEREWVVFSKQPDDPNRPALHADRFKKSPHIELIYSLRASHLIDFNNIRGLYDDTKPAMKLDESHAGWISTTGGLHVDRDLPESETDVTFIDGHLAIDRKLVQEHKWRNPANNQHLSGWFLTAVAQPPQKQSLSAYFEDIKNAAWRLSPEALIEYPRTDKELLDSRDTLIENHHKLKEVIEETDLSEILGKQKRNALASKAVGYDLFPGKS